MKIWIVIVERKKSELRWVSQEGYRTLEEAQQFCLSRKTEKVSQLMYEDSAHNYLITDITVKDRIYG